jgi:hypothetical protein
MADGDTRGAITVRAGPGDDTRVVLGTCAEWVTAVGQVTDLLLALRGAEGVGGAELPAPFAGGVAMRAWRIAIQRVFRPPGRRVVGDLCVVGSAARVLGARLCHHRAGADPDVLVVVTGHAAARHDGEPEWLVAQLARVHGVLTAPSPASADAVWRALDDPLPA